MTFGDKLSKIRKENNYTQEQLAEVLGVSRQAVSKWESDLTYPETDKLIRISELFHCSLDYLLRDTEEADRRPDGTAGCFQRRFQGNASHDTRCAQQREKHAYKRIEWQEKRHSRQ